MINWQTIKMVSMAVVTFGLSVLVKMWGDSKKRQGVYEEQLKQKKLDLAAQANIIKRAEDYAHIEASNSTLDIDELIGGVRTKPDNDS